MTTSFITLPDECPSWCSSGPLGHREAHREGCDQPTARIHMSSDVAGRTSELEGTTMSWNLSLRSDPGEDCRFWGAPYLELESHQVGDVDSCHSWRLDSGAARVLARQLLHFADAADLES